MAESDRFGVWATPLGRPISDGCLARGEAATRGEASKTNHPRRAPDDLAVLLAVSRTIPAPRATSPAEPLAVRAWAEYHPCSSSNHRMIDSIDRQILAILQRDARTPNAEIARQVGMAASATHERLRKLEERGVIEGYTVRINPERLGLGLLAFVFVRADEGVHAYNAEEQLAAMPEIQEVHHVAGEDCFLVKARVADAAALGRLLREQIGPIPSVRSTRSTIVLDTVKETGPLPLGGDEEMTDE